MTTEADIPISVKGTVTVDRMPLPNELVMVLSSYPANNIATMIMPHSPLRRRATITVCGTAGDTAYLCASQSDTSTPKGMLVQAGMRLTLCGTSEVWLIAGSGASIVVGVTTETEEVKP